MRKLSILAAFLVLSGTVCAKIVAVSDDFSTADNTLPNWVWVDIVEDSSFSRVGSQYDYDDENQAAANSYVVGMLLTGDGVQGDGGLKINVADAIQGNEVIGLSIGGTMQTGETITFTGSFYNDGTSYFRVNVQLYNLTDDRLLAETGSFLVNSFSRDDYAPYDVDDASLTSRPDYSLPSLDYTATGDDDGDVLQIRLIEDCDNIARDVYLDNFSVTTDWPQRQIRIYTVTPK